MPYYSKETIAKARQLDLLTYFQQYEPTELIKIGNNRYRTQKHSSLELSNGKWMWWAQNIGGVSALDYFHRVEGIAFTEAVGMILKLENVPVLQSNVKKPQSRLILPKPSENNERVIQYLHLRGIDLEIIYDCVAKGILYESEPYHNAVFVGFNEKGEPAYAAYRSIWKRVLGEVKGSDKAWSFRLTEKNMEEVHVFESAIDALSFLSIQKMERRQWRHIGCLALGGVAGYKNGKLPKGLETYLNHNKSVRSIILHLDNDEAGRKGAYYLQEQLEGEYEIKLEFPTQGKDVNDELQYRKQQNKEYKQR